MRMEMILKLHASSEQPSDFEYSETCLVDPKIAAPQGLTAPLVFATAAAAIGSAFQHGYNTGVLHHAPQDLVQDFINETYFVRYEEYLPQSSVTAFFTMIIGMFSLGGILGGVATVFIADRFGRKGGLIINNILALIAAAMLGFAKMAKSYEMLMVGRLVIGLNSGLNSGLAPMYLTEISPVHLRGAVGTTYGLFIAVSILVSQILGLPEILGTHEGWPILFGLIIVPAILMVATLSICPESPKFILINKGKEEDAHRALRWLRGTDDVHSEMDEIRAEYEEMKLIPKVTLKDVCDNRVLLEPLAIAIVVMISQQLSGIHAIRFHSEAIFQETGLKEQYALHATLGIGIINVFMTVVSMVLVEIAGRKILHLIGLSGMMVFTFVLIFSRSYRIVAHWFSYLSVTCVIGFITTFAIGPGSIPWFLVSELFGQAYRPIATSVAVTINWVIYFLVSFSTDMIRDIPFVVFFTLLVIWCVLTYKVVPETKGRTIKEITAEFQRESS